VEKPWEFIVMNGIIMIPILKYKMENVSIMFQDKNGMACDALELHDSIDLSLSSTIVQN
jgi:hypothetical protein